MEEFSAFIRKMIGEKAMTRMFATKTHAQFQKETDGSQMKRNLGPLDVTLIGIGKVVGAGK
jgi:amino acid permease